MANGNGNLVDMKAAMLGMTPEERLELLQEVSLEEQIKRLQEENARLKASKGGRPTASPPLGNDDVRKAKEAVVKAFVKFEQAGLDEIKAGQVDEVMAQSIPNSTKPQRKRVIDLMIEAHTITKNGKRGAGAAFTRNK